MDTHSGFLEEALPHIQAVREFAASLCKDQQRAADLAQDTMIKALRKFDSYQTGTNCRAWLFQICKHCFINDRRRDKLMPIPVDLEGSWGSSEVDGSEVREVHAVASNLQERELDRLLLGDEVSSALSDLPPEYQTVLILSDIEGYSYEEIAEMTRAPLGTVRSRIHRARKMMASRLEGYARREGFVRQAA